MQKERKNVHHRRCIVRKRRSLKWIPARTHRRRAVISTVDNSGLQASKLVAATFQIIFFTSYCCYGTSRDTIITPTEVSREAWCQKLSWQNETKNANALLRLVLHVSKPSLAIYLHTHREWERISYNISATVTSRKWQLTTPCETACAFKASLLTIWNYMCLHEVFGKFFFPPAK